MKRRGFLSGVSAGAALFAMPTTGAAKAEGPLRAFVAASLLTGFRAAVDAWRAASPEARRVLVSYGSSAALARRIELGAPADLFVSANTKWMDRLDSDGALKPGSRHALLANRLALAAAPGAAPSLASRAEIGPDLDLPAALGRRGKLAIARISSAPLGIYGRQALTRLGLWAGVAERLVEAADARAALAYVASGAAPLGVLYASDAPATAADPERPSPRRVGLFPKDSHDAIIYPIALTARAGGDAAAQDLLSFLLSPPATDVFRKFGFVAPVE